MTINLSVPRQEAELKPRITVIGVGGAGGNAVNNMIKANLEGVDFIVTNTDAQALAQTACERRIQLGVNITQGLGAGSRPDIGRAAAEEALEEILEHLSGTHMCFITAGMGGGTGTGAAPVLARAAREQGMLTVGVVTKPFHFEGAHRMKIADGGIDELQHYVDTLIVIPNQNLFRVANERTTFADAFALADNVLYSGVRGITDLMVMPGLINLDFADIRTVMAEMGKAMMGTGEAEGERRAIDAAEDAISNPLLDDVSMKGARGVLINITGGNDMTLYEVDEAANRIRDEVDSEANIIFGSIFDPGLEGRMRVSVVATGIDAELGVQPQPRTLSLVTDGGQPTSVEETPIPATAATATVAAGYAGTVPQPAVSEETRVVRPRPSMSGLANAIAHQQEVFEEPVAPVVAEAEPMPAAMPDPVPSPEPPVEPEVAEAPVAAEPAVEAPVEPAVAAAPEPMPEPAPAPLPAAPFIAPAPVEARAGTAPVAPDAFAEAAMANGARARERDATPAAPARAESAPAKSRGLSLFEKVTGVGRGRRAEPVESAESPRPEPPVGPGSGHPEADEPRLGGVSADDRPGASSVEDDLLDIPAFLRRQAN